MIIKHQAKVTHRINPFIRYLKMRNVLFCSECGYVHPTDAGLDEGDLCPDCGNGILVKV
jgi:DNA-directed RNA polymerase subunit RPC12/RpoP